MVQGTCLSTMYKTFTSVIADKLQNHIQFNDVLAVAQNGCSKGGRGCKELLLMDAAITK